MTATIPTADQWTFPIHKLDDPKVSVCLLTYNRAKYLKQAIQSVLDQEFTDFELIIADNASTDETERVVRGFSDERLIYHRHPTNIGGIRNWNYAVRQARGKYVTVFHDDDLLLRLPLDQRETAHGEALCAATSRPSIGLSASSRRSFHERKASHRECP